jgi:hypothetical protein
MGLWSTMSRRATAIAVFMFALAGLAPPGPAQAAAGGDHLAAGQVLWAGQMIVGGVNALKMQSDGNLVLYAAQNVPLWATNTSGHPGAWVIMQTDGNLVVYSAGGTPLWATGTASGPNSLVRLQSDGHIVVYAPGGVPVWGSNTYRQAYAVNRFPAYGWSAGEWPCLNALWIRESNWNELARNPHSGAYGIPQSLPASKMAVEGADYLTNPYTQIRWGENYILGRYGRPCVAWDFWLRNHWY